MPVDQTTSYDGYYNTSAGCWSVYSEVLGEEYGNAVALGPVHSLTVDTYAVQHAGGPHPDKSMAIHLAGLYLVLERGIAPPRIARLLKRLADTVRVWPHFPPPPADQTVTVFDVAICGSPEEHVETVRRWAVSVWNGWTEHHAAVASFAEGHLELE